MFVTHLLFFKHIIWYILYILYTCVMQCNKFLCCNVVGFRVFARLQLWKSGRLMNTVICNSIALALYEIGFMRKKSLSIYIWKPVFFIAAQTRSPRGESVSQSYCPFSSALWHCRQHSSWKSLPDSVSHAQFSVGSTLSHFFKKKFNNLCFLKKNHCTTSAWT